MGMLLTELIRSTLKLAEEMLTLAHKISFPWLVMLILGAEIDISIANANFIAPNKQTY